MENEIIKFLTTKEWLAGMAMSGVLANPTLVASLITSATEEQEDPTTIIARVSINYAKVLSEELEKVWT